MIIAGSIAWAAFSCPIATFLSFDSVLISRDEPIAAPIAPPTAIPIGPAKEPIPAPSIPKDIAEAKFIDSFSTENRFRASVIGSSIPNNVDVTIPAGPPNKPEPTENLIMFENVRLSQTSAIDPPESATDDASKVLVTLRIV